MDASSPCCVHKHQLLLGGPKLDDDVIEVLAEVEAERKADLGRTVTVR